MKRDNISKKILHIFGGILFTAVGCVVIPEIMRKYSNKIYKKTNHVRDIDFINIEPKIEEKEEKEEQ